MGKHHNSPFEEVMQVLNHKEARMLCFFGFLASFFSDKGEPDAQEIEDDQRQHHDRHVDRVHGGCDDSSHNSNDHDG